MPHSRHVSTVMHALEKEKKEEEKLPSPPNHTCADEAKYAD